LFDAKYFSEKLNYFFSWSYFSNVLWTHVDYGNDGRFILQLGGKYPNLIHYNEQTDGRKYHPIQPLLEHLHEETIQLQQMPSKFEHLDPLTSFNVYLLSSDVGHMLAK